MESWFIVNSLSVFIAFKALHHVCGIHYAKPLTALVVISILHTVTVMRIMRAHEGLSQRLMRARLGFPTHGVFALLQLCVFCLAVLVINWVIDTFLLTEFRIFHLPGLSYSTSEPLILGVVSFIISLVGVNVAERVMTGNGQYTFLPIFWNLGIMLVSFEVFGTVFGTHYAKPYLLFPILGLLHIGVYFMLLHSQQKSILPFLLAMLVTHFVIDTLFLTLLPVFHLAGMSYSIRESLVMGGITVISIVMYVVWFIYKLGTGFTIF